MIFNKMSLSLLFVSSLLFGAASNAPDDPSVTYITMLQRAGAIDNAPIGVDTELLFKNDTINPITLIYRHEGDGGTLEDISAYNSSQIAAGETISLGNAKDLSSVIGIRLGSALGLATRGGILSSILYGRAMDEFMPYTIPKIVLREGAVPGIIFERESALSSGSFRLRLDYSAGKRPMFRSGGEGDLANLEDISTFRVVNKTINTFAYQDAAGEYELKPGGMVDDRTKELITPSFKLKLVSRIGVPYPWYAFSLNGLKVKDFAGEHPFNPYEKVKSGDDYKRHYDIVIEGAPNWGVTLERKR